MCGLCGFISFPGVPHESSQILHDMQQVLRHRGPEAIGQFTEATAALGFTRLGIVDLAGGEQPVCSEDGTVVAVTTGEIYNHVSLRKLLEDRGHVFKGHCDTEVTPHLYEEYGVNFVEKLDGQFSIAIYDRKRNLFIGARDHFGVLPFFYTLTPSGLVFGSEIKALLCHPSVARQVDPVGLDQVLTLPGLVSPRTMFRGIRSLPPGTTVTWRPGAEPAERRYWDVSYPKMDDPSRPMTERHYARTFEELLIRSVEKRLQADVPVGLYLSGGLDSSAIGAIMRHLLPADKILSFAITFPERELSEARHQRAMSQFLGSEHHEHFMHGDEIADRLTDVIRHCECPLKESFNTAALALSEAVHDAGIKVVLTGQGADELLGGYVGYRFDQTHHARRRQSGLDWSQEAKLSARVWGDENFFYEGADVAFSRTKRWLYSDSLIAESPEFDCMESHLVDRDRLVGVDDMHRRSYIDMKVRLADHLLGDHGDRMAFANSVETRHPFLDRELVEFLATVPSSLKVRELQEKYLLKEVARSWIPESIVNREKFGFTAPGSPYLLRQRNELIESLLDPARIQSDGWFNPKAVADLVDGYSQPGFRINVPFEKDLLMTVLTFNLFLDVYDMPPPGKS